METLKLNKKVLITGTVKALSGLSIGGSNNAMGIGGPDKVVIRNPISNEPYIPGSSLKGKMRSLIEISKGFLKEMDRPMGGVKYFIDSDPEKVTSKLFGTANKEVEKQRPSRLIVRDGKLLNGSEFNNTDLPFTEAKTEVAIDRITSAANPRVIERVPAGAMFELGLVLNIFSGENEQELLEYTFKSLQMVQDDYLGGSGSRGSGQVKFTIEKVTERSSDFYHGTAEERDITAECNIPAQLL